MAWLWASWEEYLHNVTPVAIERSGLLRWAQRRSWVEVENELFEAARKLQTAAEALRKLGFAGHYRHDLTKNPDVLSQAHGLAIEAVYAGEELLLYHKRLAMDESSHTFLSQHDVLDHWERYAADGRLFRELHQLVLGIDELIKGYRRFVQAEDDFIVGDLKLPSELKADFIVARNLFSVGFEEVGLLIAGRGLEGVLRGIASVRKISLAARGKTAPANEAELYDLIETMAQLRWKKTGSRLISPETKALLHYLRTLRNSGAHAQQGSKLLASPREQATVIAEVANTLWNRVAESRARLDPITVQKTW